MSLSVTPTFFKGTCPLEGKFLLNAELFKCQSWALALYCQVRSPLISFPWIAIALALI